MNNNFQGQGQGRETYWVAILFFVVITSLLIGIRIRNFGVLHLAVLPDFDTDDSASSSSSSISVYEYIEEDEE